MKYKQLIDIQRLESALKACYIDSIYKDIINNIRSLLRK